MSESEKPDASVRRDYWLQLASQLGAIVPDEPEVTRVSAGAEEAADAGSDQKVPPRDRDRAARPLPAHPPSDWGALCEQLGLPAPPEPPSKSPAEPEPEPEPEPVLGESIEPSGPAGWDAEAESEHIEETGPELSECVSRDDHVLAEVELDELDLAEFDEDITSAAAISDELDVMREEADRLEDDLGRPERASRRRRRRGGRRAVPEEATAGESPDGALEAGTDDWDADESTSPAKESAVATPLTPEEGEESPAAVPGRRPRRRRRRTTRSGESAAADREGGESESADDDREMADAQRGDTELDIDGDEDDELSAGSAHRSKHRKIPTWEEAIGLIVTANLQARTQGDHSKNRHRGSRRRGRDGNDRNA